MGKVTEQNLEMLDGICLHFLNMCELSVSPLHVAEVEELQVVKQVFALPRAWSSLGICLSLLYGAQLSMVNSGEQLWACRSQSPFIFLGSCYVLGVWR